MLELALEAVSPRGQLPTGLLPLFQAWLDRIFPASLDVAQRVDLEALLTIIANQTIEQPVTVTDAVTLSRAHNYPDPLLQTLVDTNALTRGPNTIEVQHEALADYLRARDFARLPIDEANKQLDLLPLRFGSHLPALLMAIARDSDMQHLIWARIASDIRAACDALRYRSDTSPRFNSYDNNQASNCFLSEVLEGVNVPIEKNFAQLGVSLRSELIGEDATQLGIIGTVSHDRRRVHYSFTRASSSTDTVVVGETTNCRIVRGMDLRLSNLRLDSGRLVGMQKLQAVLFKLLKTRRLSGGPVWLEEIVTSRLRHLIREYEFPWDWTDNLNSAKTLLIPKLGRWIRPGAFSSGQTFLVDELVSEIDQLVEFGLNQIRPWWLSVERQRDLQSEEYKRQLADAIDIHYARTQYAYKEVIEANFQQIASSISFYLLLPIRYDIEIVARDSGDYQSASLQWGWTPVRTYDQAGAQVSYPPEFSVRWSDEFSETYMRRIDDALARLGRVVPSPGYTLGWGPLPDFAGHDTSFHALPDETTVVRSVIEQLNADIKDLFQQLPHSDVMF